MELITINEVLDNYRITVFDRDVEGYLCLYDESVQLYDSWNQWELKDLHALRTMASNWFEELKLEDVRDKVSFDDVVIEELGDLAFLHGTMTFIACNSSDKELRRISNRFTLGLRRVNGSWKILHQHTSLPIDIRSGKGIFTR